MVNFRVGVTLAKWQSRQLQALISPQKNIEKQEEIVRVNFIRALENSQRFIATKWMSNKKKGNFETVGKLCGIFTHSRPIPSPEWWWYQSSSSSDSHHRTLVPGSAGSRVEIIHQV